MAYISQDVNQSLAKQPVKFNGGLATLALPSVSRYATGRLFYQRLSSGLAKLPPKPLLVIIFPLKWLHKHIRTSIVNVIDLGRIDWFQLRIKLYSFMSM